MTQNGLKESKDGKTIKEGSVIKQGGRIKNWKKRWCVLNEEGLHYFKSQHSIEKGSILLAEIISVEGDDKPATKRKYCFKVTTIDRKYRICATDSLDRDEWINSIEKLLKSKGLYNIENNNNGTGTIIKTSKNVDINKLRSEEDDDSESSTHSNSYLGSNSVPSMKTIILTPIMVSLKEKFSQNTFAAELNRKKDLLSLEETERVLSLLDSYIDGEVDESQIERDREIKLIVKQIAQMKQAEMDAIENKYNQKRLEILEEIKRRS
ncbi:hypothetical protein ACTFIT_002618 [Dictyostelium discoideum]